MGIVKLVTGVAGTMAIELYNYQVAAIDKLKTGSILCGGVGSGKSRTAIGYYFLKVCGGGVKINGLGDFSEMKTPKDLYIITTAKKRDTMEWEHEYSPFMLSKKPELSINGVKVVVDSWNNLRKYIGVKNAFFIFDEQRLIGSGVWVKSFLKIAKSNQWILLSATPGDTWSDYIPVFIANGFYKNRTEFTSLHIIYSRFSKYPKIDRYLGVSKLCKLRDQITVIMHYTKPTIAHDKIIQVSFNNELVDKIMMEWWNPFKNRPIKSISELCYIIRKVVNSDKSRLYRVRDVFEDHPRLIVFYNFDYELDLLRSFGNNMRIPIGEWNGHKHESIPDGQKWLYLVQYTAGAEGWNCILTDTILFYSQNYSYKIMTQAAGRIDRLNSPFKDLYYYHLRSNSSIDLAISKALRNKKNFNIRNFINE